MTLDGCSSRVAALCDEAVRRVESDAVRDGLGEVRERLAQPLRVAVAGRVKSGKSTLVNALLRHQVAPTAAGECTRAVTWFRSGYPPEATLVFADRQTRRLPLLAGQRLPEQLGVDPAGLDRVDVQLSSDALEEMVVIDTPGLASATDEYSAATRRALAVGTEDAARRADALVFVLTGAARQDEVAVLEAFRSHLGGIRGSAINTLVVLNKADLLGDEDDDDPLAIAGDLARRYAQRLGSLAAAVVPTVGLVAETIEAGLLTESDVAVLARLAQLEGGVRRRLLDNVLFFLDTPCSVSRADRHRVLSRLGLYGTRRCLEWIDEGRTGVAPLRGALAELTGVAEVRMLIEQLFVRRADLLKAANALADLEQLALRAMPAHPADASWLAHAAERARLDPTLRALATTWVFAQVVARGTELPEDLQEDLRRVTLGSDLAEMLGASAGADVQDLQRAAMRASARWRAHAYTADSEHRRMADVMCQQYAALFELAG